MKLKYYLRGLGIGMAVTAVIMGVSARGARPMSDEQIKARAAELGMIENTVLAAPETEQIEEGTQGWTDESVSATGQPLEEGFGTEDMSVTEETARQGETPTQEESASETQTQTETPAQTEAAEDTEPVGEVKFKVIAVRGGDGSYQISQRLQAEGLIEDAVEFDNFLCGNGYSSKLRTGEHRIPEGATEAEIARLLTGG